MFEKNYRLKSRKYCCSRYVIKGAPRGVRTKRDMHVIHIFTPINHARLQADYRMCTGPGCYSLRNAAFA